MKFHAFAQLDGVGETIVGNLGQLGGEKGLDFRVLLSETIEALVNVAAHNRGLAVVEIRRIEGAGIGSQAVGDAVGGLVAGSGLAVTLLLGPPAGATNHAHHGGSRNCGSEQPHELAPAELELVLFHLNTPFPFQPAIRQAACAGSHTHASERTPSNH